MARWTAVQTAVIGGAEAYVGPLGGMSFVAQAHGRRSFGVRARAAPTSEGLRELLMAEPDASVGRLEVIELEEALQLVPWILGEEAEPDRSVRLAATS